MDCRTGGSFWKGKAFCQAHLVSHLVEENLRLEQEISTYWLSRVHGLERALLEKTSQLGAYEMQVSSALHGAFGWLSSIKQEARGLVEANL